MADSAAAAHTPMGECSICLGALVDATSTPCQHVYCRECIARVVVVGGASAICPLCRASLILRGAAVSSESGLATSEQPLLTPLPAAPARTPCCRRWVPEGSAYFLVLWTALFCVSLYFIFAGPSPNSSTRSAEGCGVASWLLFAGRVCYGLAHGGVDHSGGFVTYCLAALFAVTLGLAINGYRLAPTDAEAGVVLAAALMAAVGGPSLWLLLAQRGRTRAAVLASERVIPRLVLGTRDDLAESSSLPPMM